MHLPVQIYRTLIINRTSKSPVQIHVLFPFALGRRELSSHAYRGCHTSRRSVIALMVSDLCAEGREVTCFSIYDLVGKSTAWIGPLISGIIIYRTGNTWEGFPCALAMMIVGFRMICYVNVKKGEEQCDAWALSGPTLRAVNGDLRIKGFSCAILLCRIWV